MSNVNESYRKLILLMMHSKRHLMQIMDEMKMTPVQGMMLMMFEDGKGRSMHELSVLMGCDASNVTGLVDRLDNQGLIERTVDENDRRVKMIKLREKGEKCRAAVIKGLREAEAADIAKLTEEERQWLIRITEKIACSR